MRLQGIDFGPIWNGAGAQGFFGEGYAFHRYAKLLGLSFANVTFVAKTATAKPRAGNMPLREDFTPAEFKPRCIWLSSASWAEGYMLNAVGLSNPGAAVLAQTGHWQLQDKPFFLSFMQVEGTREARLNEAYQYVHTLRPFLSDFRAPVALQLNVSCPNTQHHAEGIEEIAATLSILQELGIPIVVKISVDMSVHDAREIAAHPACDGLCISNTVPFGKLKTVLGEDSPFPSKGPSPLMEFGGGGLSGAPLLNTVVEWIRGFRWAYGTIIPINAGGGILHPMDVRRLRNVGANSVSIASVAVLRPWQMKKIIRTARRVLG